MLEKTALIDLLCSNFPEIDPKTLWLTECEITRDNLHEWVDDLFIYTDEQLCWVLPKILLIFLDGSGNETDLMQLIDFLNVEKSPDLFPDEPDNWPGGLLSEAKKYIFESFTCPMCVAVREWLILIATGTLNIDHLKEIRSATKYWSNFVARKCLKH